ncbi:CHAT domain-containing protein [Halorussus gelatinilyticus]|uniref:CHAT domain-containing protein n=1 Tax=Halorussus gelatinilyticus TaxID=2937524 RepID=A0A8U0IJ65_9EURY|nr:CHAT domain-containing protein [Halorussus gelatinilyticus]UPW00332.1 CHAT domain-containing protein [Halorussus gelatinilyticus]
MRPRIDSLGDPTGVEIVDLIESHRFLLYTPKAVSPTPTDTERFVYPVTVACRFTTSDLRLSYPVPVGVRRREGREYICDVTYGAAREFEAGAYVIEIPGPPKLYLHVESALTVDATNGETRIAFGGETTVVVGTRSSHESPAATITVPDDPASVMRGVSRFGSALKTTSPERSWPTLRGHPPRVERGDELRIPDELEAIDTGVTIRVPADYEHVFPVASLAYYLGAAVSQGDRPRLTTKNGFSYPLGGGADFEEEVARVLRQVFVLDCATRTEGFHPADLAERRLVESVVDLDFAALYDAPLAERLETYLSVPETLVDDVKPTWGRETYVRPVADGIESLPYVARDLSVVRVKSPASTDTSRSRRSGREALHSFKRSGMESDHSQSVDADEAATGVPAPDEYVPLPTHDGLERAWVGDGTPVHGAKLHPEAFRHERTDSTDGVIDVTVVCNDEEMREELNAVSEVYGSREVVPFDVDFRVGVPTEELRALLAADNDLFHFIGHVDGRGLECPDGVLDAETLSENGATAVLLNACRSHDQGVALVEAGAHAAIVSWGDVGNLGAMEVGETFAKLLNYGFSVGSALELVEEYTSIGRHYVTIGNPNVTVAQCEDGLPVVYEVLSGEVPKSGEIDIELTAYPAPTFSIGAAVSYHFRGADDPEFFTAPAIARFTNEVEEIVEEVATLATPMIVDDELRWTDELFSEDGTTR